MANKVKPTNTILLQGWMITELGLSGTSLIIYALIYGFTQTDDQWFYGSVDYIRQWANVTDKTARTTINNLVEKGYIDKKFTNGVTCSYRANLSLVDSIITKLSIKTPVNSTEVTSSIDKATSVNSSRDPGKNDSPSPVKITDNNNIYNNKDNNNTNNEKSSEPIEEATEHNMKLPTTIDPVKEVVNSYNSICESFPKLQKLTYKRITAVKRILSSYSLDEIKRAFELAEKSDFLSGRKKTDNHYTWRCSFDWLINPNNMVKVLEGNYNKESSIASEPRDSDKKYWEKQMEKTNGLF